MTQTNACPFHMNDDDFSRDPYPRYEVLRKESPLLHADEYFEEYGRGGYWFLTRYDDTVSVLKDWETFSSADPKVLSIPAMVPRDFPLLPQDVDPPLHTRYRGMVNPTFTKRRVDERYEAFRDIQIQLMDEVMGEGDVDLVTRLTQKVSLLSLAEFAGLPRKDSDKWRHWVEQLLMGHRNPTEAAEGKAAFTAYIDELVEEHRLHPADDFISMLMAPDAEGSVLDRTEMHGFMILILIGGHDTTSSAMSTTLAYLADHPETLEELRRGPELIPSAVEEFLRYSSPIQAFARVVTKDVELYGQQIKKGEVVVVSYGSANRDPEVFDQAEEVVLTRRPNKHVTFGAGPHTCIGANVARLEIRIMLELLVERVARVEALPDRPREWKLRGDKQMLDSLWGRLVPLPSS